MATTPDVRANSESLMARARVAKGSFVREGGPSSALALTLVLLLAWVLPSRSRNPLAETAVWSLLLVVSFIGWGSLVRFVVAPKERVDVGLRGVWGAGLLCFLGGALMVSALMVRTTALVLVEIGLGLALVSLARERIAVQSGARLAARLLRREPALALLAAGVAFLVAVQCLGAIADWHINPYDDDIAYLAFLKKLSDTGTILEPFSFRRLSAFGGQTFFLELVSIRAAPSQAHTWDRCVCILLTSLLVVGHRSRGRRPGFLFISTSIVVLVVLPSIAINTASYYSGVFFFLGLFRTLVWLEERTGELRGRSRISAWRAALPVALVSAAVCTLRQNYLPVPVFVLAASYIARLARTKGPVKRRLTEPLYAAGLSLVALVPWFVVSWQSNRTFLYPLMLGTFHAPLALNANAWNLVREVSLQVSVLAEGVPMETLGLFFVAAAFDRESGTRVPLKALCVGSLAGFVLLVHGLTQGDAINIGRYAFAFLFATMMAAALTFGSVRWSTRPGRQEVAAALVLFGMLVQIVSSREKFWKEYETKFHNIELLAYAWPRTKESNPPELKMYAERLQGAVPPGERIAAMVDEPYHLDFRRNPIWNLDQPGFSSLPPGLPSFQGSEALEQYFHGLGVRWLMFVTPEHSRYHYRREYFMQLFVDDQELWRGYAPYMVDFIDNVTKIRARRREAYAENGIVVIDLEQPREPETPAYEEVPPAASSREGGAPAPSESPLPAEASRTAEAEGAREDEGAMAPLEAGASPATFEVPRVAEDGGASESPEPEASEPRRDRR